MNNRPIHSNLDTSFVNLSALVKYLRRRQFEGIINIQLNGYRAEISLNAEGKMVVREHDQISGRVSDGEEAFQRLLIRAREPGGTVNVFQKTKPNNGNGKPAVKQNSAPTPVANDEVVEAIPVRVIDTPISKPANPPVYLPAKNGAKPGLIQNGNTQIRYKVETPAKTPEPIKQNGRNKLNQPPLPDFPFKLTNDAERRMNPRKLSTNDWQKLLKLSVELLGVVDRSLGIHGLDFTAAFRKARTEIAEDYPFMNPAEEKFDYEQGRITMKEQVNRTVYVNSIVESLRRILQKLGNNPKFSVAYRDTAQLIISLLNKRKLHYDRFGLTVPIKRMLGV